MYPPQFTFNLAPEFFLLIFLGIVWLLGCAVFFPSAAVSLIGPLAWISFGFGMIAGPLTNMIIKLSSTHVGLLSALIGLSMTGMGCLGSLLCSLLFTGTMLSLSVLITIAASCAVFGMSRLKKQLYHVQIK